jgi:hypothetical protein
MARRAGEAFFALPVTVSGTERWGPLAGFEPGQLSGPWETELEALESPSLQRGVRTGMDEVFIGGPCWFRWTSGDEAHRGVEWIPLIYRRVSIDEHDGRLKIVPAQDGWSACPLVSQYLDEHNIQAADPLDEMLPDLLSVAQSKAGQDGHGLARALVDAFRLVLPELGEMLDEARDTFPADRVEFVPSPWVLFTASPGDSAIARDILHDYDLLEHHLKNTPHNIGGLGRLENLPGAPVQAVPEFAPIVPLSDAQRSVVETALAVRPLTVINGPPGSGKGDVISSILLNAWASSTSVLYASNDDHAIRDICERLEPFESDAAIAVQAGDHSLGNVDTALGRTIDLIRDHRGESHYGGSQSDRKQGQLTRRRQQLREMLDNNVPQRLGQAIDAALESHAAQRDALSTLASQREELIGRLRALGVDDEPNAFAEGVIDPLRKWRNGIDATARIIKDDAQRNETLQMDLAAARADLDSALADCQVEPGSDQAASWLLTEPGFESFEKALTALSEKLQDPIEDTSEDTAWDPAYDAWSSSEEAADWERKARELAALLRPAGIALKEKSEEVRAANEAMDAAERTFQQAISSTNVSVQREDVEEWASCYAELCALPRGKLAIRSKSKSSELIRRLEKVEGKLRLSLPVHLWTNIGALNETGRSRLAPVIDRAREWMSARDDWDRLGPVREEIEADTDALRRRLGALGNQSLSSELTPKACGSIAARLNEKAAGAASAATAWGKRETRERLPNELAILAAQIVEAGTGTPVKERWMKEVGAQLVTALDAVAGNPGVETLTAVRTLVLGPIAADPTLESWGRAYHAERERAAIAEEMERIPSRAARLSSWKSRRPASLPAEFDAEDAFDGGDAHPVWAFLRKCEEWSGRWAAYRDDQAASLEQTASSKGAEAIGHIREAAGILPKSKERAWLETFAESQEVNEPWPVDTIGEIAVLWRPERLREAAERIDAQLEKMTFETARERWLERVGHHAEVLRALGELRDHYRKNNLRIEEDGYPHFGQTLKAQSVWITATTSTKSIPMQPGLFDLLVIDEATRCTLTEILPLIFRAKRVVVIGDPAQTPPAKELGMEDERRLAEQFGIDEWIKLLGNAGNDIYKSAANVLPGGQAEVISLASNGDIPL